MILVIRIAGQVKNKKKDNETLNRLNLRKKFSATIVPKNNPVLIGMVNSVAHMVSYGKISEDFAKKMKKRESNRKNVFHLHPPRGGFKKSSKVAAPKGILGNNDDITKLAGRML